MLVTRSAVTDKEGRKMADINEALLNRMSDEDLKAFSENNLNNMSDAGLRLLTGEKTFFERAGGVLGRNMEIPGAVAGGISGAVIGSAVPVVGTVVGGIVGAAMGSFGGSLGSDAYEGRRLDFNEATKEGALSVGFDVATLGMGKLIRPIANSMGVNPADFIMKISGAGRRGAEPPRLTDLPTNVARGSDESLNMTQRLLEEGNGSLSAAQTGQASFLRATADEIGEIGLFSGGHAAKRIKANDAVLRREVDSLVDGADASLTTNAHGVGEVVYGVVEAGRRAAGQLYGEGLTKIVKEFGDKELNLSQLRTLTKSFQSKYSNPISGNDGLANGVRTIIKDMENGVFSVRNGKLSNVLNLDKQISDQIDQFMPGSSLADPNAVRQLSQFRTELRKAIQGTISKRSKGTAAAYQVLKDSYGESMGDLLPKISRNVIQKAKDQDYDALGNLLIKQTNLSKVQTMMKSIDRSFLDIALANAGKEASDPSFIVTGVKDAARAKAIVKQSYLKNIFQDATEEVVDFKGFRSQAIRLSKTDQLDKAKAILGSDFGQYKRLINAISDSTDVKTRGLFSLALRSKEISSLGKMGIGGSMVGGAVTMASFGAMLPAVAILTVPSVLARIATNPKAVNALLLLNGQVKKNPNLAPELVASGIAKVMANLSEEDRASLQQEFR